MKKQKWLICFLLLSFCAPRWAEAQTTLIVQKRAIVSLSLSGHVKIGLEKVVGRGVLVELCSPDWITVSASTKTDDNGYFSLEHPPGYLFYLRFSSPGVNPFQVKVRISKHAAHDLSIYLNIAT
jgi:hypothetical protein